MAKRRAPATLRNREAIADVLAQELPDVCHVLEIASGSGEHAVHFAALFDGVTWQPSDPDDHARASIAAYRAEYRGGNLRAPLAIDASDGQWWQGALQGKPSAIICINMVHISPWEATLGLFAGAAQILGGSDLPLLLYGPYFEQGVETAPSNTAFDESLRARNPAWGIRYAEKLDEVAAKNGLSRTARYQMPANNLMLAYRAIGTT